MMIAHNLCTAPNWPHHIASIHIHHPTIVVVNCASRDHPAVIVPGIVVVGEGREWDK